MAPLDSWEILKFRNQRASQQRSTASFLFKRASCRLCLVDPECKTSSLPSLCTHPQAQWGVGKRRHTLMYCPERLQTSILTLHGRQCQCLGRTATITDEWRPGMPEIRGPVSTFMHKLKDPWEKRTSVPRTFPVTELSTCFLVLHRPVPPQTVPKTFASLGIWLAV